MECTSMLSNLLTAASIYLTLVMSSTIQEGHTWCVDQTQCGWNSVCEAGSCHCLPDFHMSSTGGYCIDTSCNEANCLECTGRVTCRRCVHYIEGDTGRCMDECHTSYQLVIEGVYVGRVCQSARFVGLRRVYMTVIIAISICVIIIIILFAVVYCKISAHREKRLRVRIMEKILHKERLSQQFMTSTHLMNHSAGKVNGAYGGSQTVTVKSLSLDSRQHSDDRTSLCPYLHKLLQMLQLANRREHHLHPADPNVTVYRLIAQNLERVVTLIGNQNARMPPDGQLLMRWAKRLLHDYTARQKMDASSQLSGQSMSTVPTRSTHAQPFGGSNSSQLQHAFIRSGLVENNLEISEVTLDRSNFTEPINV